MTLRQYGSFSRARFPAFQVEYRLSDSREWRTQRAVSVTASRIRNLGGLFRGLTADSRLHHPHLLVHLLAGPAHLALPAWAALGKVGLARANPWLTTLAVEELKCLPLHPEQPVYAQLDGEAMGPLPFTLRIVPSALWFADAPTTKRDHHANNTPSRSIIRISRPNNPLSLVAVSSPARSPSATIRPSRIITTRRISGRASLT